MREVMITVMFSGGVGNQLFQYAFYEYIKLRFPNIKVKAGIRGYKKNGDRQFELYTMFYGIVLDEATVMDVYRCIELPRRRPLNNPIRKIIESVICAARKTKAIDVWPEDDCLNILNPENNNYCINGCWNSEKYIEEIDSFINMEKIFDSNVRFKDIRGDEWLGKYADYNTVGIHVRGGDYKLLDEYDVLDGYYIKAIDEMNKRVEKPLYLVFSDETDYAKTIISPADNVIYVGDELLEKDRNDLYLLSCCNHNIIANSTYSFWGALLNKNKNKVVIAPKRVSKNRDEALAYSGWITV